MIRISFTLITLLAVFSWGTFCNDWRLVNPNQSIEQIPNAFYFIYMPYAQLTDQEKATLREIDADFHHKHVNQIAGIEKRDIYVSYNADIQEYLLYDHDAPYPNRKRTAYYFHQLTRYDTDLNYLDHCFHEHNLFSATPRSMKWVQLKITLKDQTTGITQETMVYAIYYNVVKTKLIFLSTNKPDTDPNAEPIIQRTYESYYVPVLENKWSNHEIISEYPLQVIQLQGPIEKALAVRIKQADE